MLTRPFVSEQTPQESSVRGFFHPKVACGSSRPVPASQHSFPIQSVPVWLDALGGEAGEERD